MIGLRFKKLLVAAILEIVDLVGHITAFNSVSNNEINITVYCKAGIDKIIGCIIISAGFSDASHIILIGIRSSSLTIIEI